MMRSKWLPWRKSGEGKGKKNGNERHMGKRGEVGGDSLGKGGGQVMELMTEPMKLAN